MELNEIQITRNIKSCREKYGKTQEMVAKILKISKVTYIKMENKPLNYNMKKLNLVANAIGCKIDDFFMQ